MSPKQLISVLVGLAVLAGVSGFVGGLVSNGQPADEASKGVIPNKVGLVPVNAFDRGVRWVNEGFFVGANQDFGVDSSGNASTTGSYTVNGVKYVESRMTMVQGTTTPCALQAPTNATSTLEDFTVNFTTSTTTASIVTIAKATNAFSTTTRIGSAFAIAANGQATIQASTTPSASTVFAPGEWIVVGMAGGGGSFSPVGACSPKWRTAT